MEWLKIVATDEHILIIRKYHEPCHFDDYYLVRWSATVLERGMLRPCPIYLCHSDYCADVLRHIVIRSH